VNHKIMAKAGRKWQAARHLLSADHEQDMLTVLHAAADEVLTDITAQADFVHGTFWAWEQDDLRFRLERAVRRMLHDAQDWSDFRVAAVEQGFNPQENAPLKIDTPAGPVLVIGRIDRLDQRDDNTLAVIDYKSNRSPRPAEETISGRDVQLPIYLLAAEQVIAPGQQVELAAFFHLGSGKRSRPLTSKQRAEALEAMRARLAETLHGVQTGDFAVRPRDTCPTGCAFETICRRNLAKRDANQ
jgi:RecB family exonuclease